MYDLKYRPTFIYRDKVNAGNRIWCVDYSIILNDLFHPVPTKVIYCYGEYQKEFDELRGVDFIEGFPQDLNELTQGHDQTLLVLDDLMSECSKDQRVSDLFTRGSHHKGITVLYLTQNLFPPGKLSRNHQFEFSLLHNF